MLSDFHNSFFPKYHYCDFCAFKGWVFTTEMRLWFRLKRAINRKNITMFSNRCSLWLKAWVYQIIERNICNIMPQWGIESKNSGIFMKYSMYLELTTTFGWAKNLKDVLLKFKRCAVICLGNCHSSLLLILRQLPYS